MRYSVKTYPDLLHYSLQVSGNRISRRILDIQPQLSDRPNTYLNIRQDTRYQQRADIRFIPYLRLYQFGWTSKPIIYTGYTK